MNIHEDMTAIVTTTRESLSKLEAGPLDSFTAEELEWIKQDLVFLTAALEEELRQRYASESPMDTA